MGGWNAYKMYRATGDVQRAVRMFVLTLGAWIGTFCGAFITIISVPLCIAAGNGYDKVNQESTGSLLWLFAPMLLIGVASVIAGLWCFSTVKSDFIQTEIEQLEAEEWAERPSLPGPVITTVAVTVDEPIQATYPRQSRRVIIRRR
jgi:hypothetical protein